MICLSVVLILTINNHISLTKEQLYNLLDWTNKMIEYNQGYQQSKLMVDREFIIDEIMRRNKYANRRGDTDKNKIEKFNNQ